MPLNPHSQGSVLNLWWFSSRMTPEAEDLDRISQLDAALDESDKELAKLSKKTDPIEADIKRLQDEILAVGGTKLRVQQTKVSDIKERLDLLSDRLTKAEVARSKAEKDVVKLEKALETNKAAEEELEGSLDELEKKIARNNVGSENFRSQVEAVQATLEEAREGLTERKSELDVIGGQMKKFREKEVRRRLSCTFSRACASIADCQRARAGQTGARMHQNPRRTGRERSQVEPLATQSGPAASARGGR